MKPVVYTSGDCPYCVAVKEFLKNSGIEFVEKNIHTSPEGKKELMRLGYSLVPVLVYGETVIPGFDPGRLNELKNELIK